MYNWWKSGNPDMIVRMADGKDIKFLFERGHNRIPIGPTLRAVFIKDGKMLGIIDQDTIKIADEWKEEKIHTVYWKKETDEGIFKRFFRKLAGREKEEEYEAWDYHETITKRVVDGYINVLLVDATTIDLPFSINAGDDVFTADARENLSGRLTVRFEFDPLQTPKQMKLLTKSKAMTVQDLCDRIRDEIISEVVKPVLNGFNSDEIYGNREIREMSEMAVMHEMEKTFDTWGIKLHKVIFNLDTPDRIKMDHELKKKKAEIDQEIDKKELEWKKTEVERLHRKEIEDQQWKDELERKEREREYQHKLTKEKEQWEDEQKEKAREEGKKLEKDKIELEENKHRLEMRKQRAEIDQNSYMTELMSIRRRTRELQMEETRRERGKMDMEKEWDRHKRKMDQERQRYERDLERKEQEHMQEMERKHQEDLAELKRLDHAETMKRMDVDVKESGIRTADEQIKQLQREIHELEMKMMDAPTERMPLLQSMYDKKTEQYKELQNKATERQLGTVGGEATSIEFMKMQGEKAKFSLEGHKTAVQEEREHQNQNKQWVRATIDKSIDSIQRVHEAPVGTFGTSIQQPLVQQQIPSLQEFPTKQGNTCISCGHMLESTVKFCNNCGAKQDVGQMCINCKKPIKSGTKFCNYCGSPQILGCPQCGTEVETGIRFCSNCGYKFE